MISERNSIIKTGINGKVCFFMSGGGIRPEQSAIFHGEEEGGSFFCDPSPTLPSIILFGAAACFMTSCYFVSL